MSDSASQISEAFHEVGVKINEELASLGREKSSVKLVVVTKGQSPEKMQAVINAGAQFLGENYPEESAEKIPLLVGIQNLEWHMIGHVQSRKIKYLVQYFDLIESVESLATAEKLNLRFLEAGEKKRILLEVNFSGEVSKQGFPLANKSNWPGFMGVVEQIRRMKSLQLTGLMTMPPLSNHPEDSRTIFHMCKELKEFINSNAEENVITELSMGTSFDYLIAISEGATIVRVGEAIMGHRIYR